MTLNEISVRPIESHEIERYDELMQTHHYLGAARPIGESLRYVALWHHQWVALLGFSQPVECSACTARQKLGH